MGLSLYKVEFIFHLICSFRDREVEGSKKQFIGQEEINFAYLAYLR